MMLKDSDYPDTGIISQLEYNKLAKILMLEQLNLQSNQIFIVNGTSNAKASNLDLEENDSYKILNNKSSVQLEVVEEGQKSITPEGYYRNLLVVEDDLYNSLDARQFSIDHVNIFNIGNWKEDLNTADSLEAIVTDNGENPVGFFIAGRLYETEKMAKNLMLYIGCALSCIFLLASASMIYFRLVTEKEKEALKYKNLMKLGLSKKEFSQIHYKYIAVLMYVPFLIATLFLFLQKKMLMSKLNLNYTKVTIISFLVFLLLQTSGYFVTVNNYKKSLLHGD